MDTLKVLVVDDEYGVRHSVRRALKRHTCELPALERVVGFDVLEADTGERALELLATEGDFDLMLLDYKLPGRSGVDVLHEIEGRYPKLLTIMVTAFATIETAVRATKAGAYDFIAKPFTPDELREALNKTAEHLVAKRRALELADEKRRVRFDFIRVLGHELKAPLGAIEGFLYLLEGGAMGQDLSSYEDVVARCLRRTRGMRKLITDLLDMTRIEAGERRRELGDVDVAALARELVDQHQTELRANENALRLTLSLDAPDSLVMRGDKSELQIVIDNLVSNAIKYNVEGGRVAVALRGDEDTATVEVVDTGIGIAPDDAAKLFNDFVRVNRKETKHILGSGLGLSIVKKIATLYRGDAKVESTLGEGSRFTVTLTRHLADDEAAAVAQGSEPLSTVQGRRIAGMTSIPNILGGEPVDPTRRHAMRRARLEQWLHEDDPARLNVLWRTADRIRREHVGDEVHLRGLIEIGNHCRRDCLYCGIRHARRDHERYRLSAAEILACAAEAKERGFGSVVLQSGEDPEFDADAFCRVVREIKSRHGLAVTLSLGELEDGALRALFDAGADRYLLRFETADMDLHLRIHPPVRGQRRDRFAVLRALREIGYEVGSGIMVGIPGQSYGALADDLLMFEQLDLDMIGVGPFVPHPDTPLGRRPDAFALPPGEQVPADETMTCKVLALARLLRPNANLPSTTALATVDRENGREFGLRRGANVLMPNLTPAQYRPSYEIYPSKACLTTDDERTLDELPDALRRIGRRSGHGPGQSPNYRDRIANADQTSATRTTTGNMSSLPKIKTSLSTDFVDFIDEERLHGLMELTPDRGAFVDVLQKSLAKQPLTPEETAVLIAERDPERIEQMFDVARTLKQDVYGNRIVLFAPLYVGNHCINDCRYCGFRRSNPDAVRRTLTDRELVQQVEALQDVGHKRLILVFGEHPSYDANYIADTVRKVYATRKGHGEIRRVNINAAPLDHDGYRIVKESGIGTYQVFQETYHHATYARVHPKNTLKGDYDWRLDALSRAWETGLDDVGIGALFGLYDWRFETLGLVAHANHLMERFNCGPHTISFPRLRPATGIEVDPRYAVSDDDFARLVAILRLSVPYTGMILTARETPELRRKLMGFGVSQIDAGSRIELGGYTEAGDATHQVLEKEQFELGDVRSLDTVIKELVEDGYVPSFCTACYRLGRTGEEFMEYAIPGFIQRFCSPNACTTLQEYLTDYATDESRPSIEARLRQEVREIEQPQLRQRVQERMKDIEDSEQRDLYF